MYNIIKLTTHVVLNIINYYNYIYYIGEEHVDSVPKRPRTDLEGLDEVPCQSTIQRKRPHDIIGMSVLRNIILFYIKICSISHRNVILINFTTTYETLITPSM